jgi:hypothetical protein
MRIAIKIEKKERVGVGGMRVVASLPVERE